MGHVMPYSDGRYGTIRYDTERYDTVRYAYHTYHTWHGSSYDVSARSPTLGTSSNAVITRAVGPRYCAKTQQVQMLLSPKAIYVFLRVITYVLCLSLIHI